MLLTFALGYGLAINFVNKFKNSSNLLSQVQMELMNLYFLFTDLLKNINDSGPGSDL